MDPQVRGNHAGLPNATRSSPWRAFLAWCRAACGVVASVVVSFFVLAVVVLLGVLAERPFGLWPPTGPATALAALAGVGLVIAAATTYLFLEFLERSWLRLMSLAMLFPALLLPWTKAFALSVHWAELLVACSPAIFVIVGGCAGEGIHRWWEQSAVRRTWHSASVPQWVRRCMAIVRLALITVCTLGMFFIAAWAASRMIELESKKRLAPPVKSEVVDVPS